MGWGVRGIFVLEECEGSPMAGRPVSRQMADGTSRQKSPADFSPFRAPRLKSKTQNSTGRRGRWEERVVGEGPPSSPHVTLCTLIRGCLEIIPLIYSVSQTLSVSSTRKYLLSFLKCLKMSHE